jgi:nucleoside-diphosphate-sugar epimerase
VSAENQSFTVLGAAGFIGASLVATLEERGHIVHAVTRASLPSLFAARRRVGHVIDCIGLTGDFRVRPLSTAEAHVGLVARCLSDLRLDSFLLLSSTRVYARGTATYEDAALPTLPADPSDLYNLTKLAGEALCLSDPRPTIRVARLSNVYGRGIPATTFVGQVLEDGFRTGRVVLQQRADSAKDYISLDLVSRILPMIATTASHRLYNVAAGINTTHEQIAKALHTIAGWEISFVNNAVSVRNLPIETSRIRTEFGASTCSLIADLPGLIPLEQVDQCSPSTSCLAA